MRVRSVCLTRFRLQMFAVDSIPRIHPVLTDALAVNEMLKNPATHLLELGEVETLCTYNSETGDSHTFDGMRRVYEEREDEACLAFLDMYRLSGGVSAYVNAALSAPALLDEPDWLSVHYNGVHIAGPLSTFQDDDVCRSLWASAQPSSFGNAVLQTTDYDEKVRLAREVPRSAFALSLDCMRTIEEDWCLAFGHDGLAVPVVAVAHKLNVYGPGGHFSLHRDTPRRNLLSTVIVNVTQAAAGGRLMLAVQEPRSNTQSGPSDPPSSPSSSFAPVIPPASSSSSSSPPGPAGVGAVRLVPPLEPRWKIDYGKAGHWCAFHPETLHRVETVEAGHRITVAIELFAADAVFCLMEWAVMPLEVARVVHSYLPPYHHVRHSRVLQGRRERSLRKVEGEKYQAEIKDYEERRQRTISSARGRSYGRHDYEQQLESYAQARAAAKERVAIQMAARGECSDDEKSDGEDSAQVSRLLDDVAVGSRGLSRALGQYFETLLRLNNGQFGIVMDCKYTLHSTAPKGRDALWIAGLALFARCSAVPIFLVFVLLLSWLCPDSAVDRLSVARPELGVHVYTVPICVNHTSSHTVGDCAREESQQALVYLLSDAVLDRAVTAEQQKKDEPAHKRRRCDEGATSGRGENAASSPGLPWAVPLPFFGQFDRAGMLWSLQADAGADNTGNESRAAEADSVYINRALIVVAPGWEAIKGPQPSTSTAEAAAGEASDKAEMDEDGE